MEICLTGYGVDNRGGLPFITRFACAGPPHTSGADVYEACLYHAHHGAWLAFFWEHLQLSIYSVAFFSFLISDAHTVC
jgi:hypothetical protein